MLYFAKVQYFNICVHQTCLDSEQSEEAFDLQGCFFFLCP